MSARITTQQLASEINDLKSMFAMFMAMQTGANAPAAPAVEAKHVPTQAPANEVPVANDGDFDFLEFLRQAKGNNWVVSANPEHYGVTQAQYDAAMVEIYGEPEVQVAEPYVPDAPKAAVEVAPVKHDAKTVIPSVAAWQHDGVLWIAFPPMGTCADEANVLYDALKGEAWFVNFDKSGNASPKKSVRVLPYIADKGLAAKYSGHSASIGSFDRAPKLADVAKRVKEIFAARKIVPVKVAKPAVKVAPAKSDMPVFA